MTSLAKSIHRRTIGALDGSFGPDRSRRLIASFLQGDLLSLRPEGTRRAEQVSLFDVYRFAVRCRVGRTQLEKARDKKQRLKARRESAAIARAERRLTRES